MQNQTPIEFDHFDQQSASKYDTRFAKLAPMHDVLHLLTSLVLEELPENAKVLCVGAGTGAELLYLAQVFPRWSFTVVEPAPAMMEICRRRAKESGIHSRCDFHEGYVATLAESALFDAATSFLVSHFIVDANERSGFFSSIATRIRPGGYFVNAELVADTASESYTRMFEMWIRAMKYTGVQGEDLQKFLRSFQHDIAILPQSQLITMLRSNGFTEPTLFCQTMFIHAWFSQIPM